MTLNHEGRTISQAVIDQDLQRFERNQNMNTQVEELASRFETANQAMITVVEQFG